MGEQLDSALGLSILVVDDNDAVRAVIVRSLTLAGYRVSEANSAFTAMAALKNRVPDLVVTDIFMPDGDGLEIMNEIRGRELSVPVLVISGGGTAVGGDYLGVANRLGATSTLRKPFKNRQLLDAVELALRPSSSAAWMPDGKPTPSEGSC